MDPRRYVIESALRHGVDPKIALSVWQQESGGSTDLGLRGQTIQKGKWKGHWARGPWQIMTFHGEIPDSFEGQTDWAMRHLKERGVRGYYGEGTPGVAGHPSTDQYEAQVLRRAGRLPVDVRMASADSELPPEMQTPGDPRTGQAQMNGSLPPELGDMPFGAQMYQDLMAEQEAQKPSFGERLATDPFFQMGAAILGAPGHGGNFMTAVGQGMSQGLQNAQAAEAARRETMQNQVRNRLWMEQLNNERFRLLGGEQPNAFELGQMEYQRGQIANKAKENWLREQGLYDGGAGSPDMEPWGIVGPDGSVRYESVPKGQVPRTAPDERIFNPRVGKQTASGESGRSSGTSTDAFLSLIGDVESLAAEISSSSGMSPLGTVGNVGAKLSAWAGIADQLLGTELSGKLKETFGGADPRVIRGRLQAAVLPVARLLVDPKGPLSGNEQDQAKRLVGVLEGDSVLSGEQAMDLLQQTLRLAKKAAGATASGELPPETATEGPPPSGGVGLSPEDQAELERLRQQQGGF
jgi:hypothetical protein